MSDIFIVTKAEMDEIAKVIQAGLGNNEPLTFPAGFKSGIQTIISKISEPIDVYTVTFDVNGQTIDIEPQQIMKGGTITKPDDPEVVGYTFEGWYKETECLNQWDFSVDTVSSNITLYAKLIKSGSIEDDPVEVPEVGQGTYTITFINEDGTVLSSKIYNEGDTVVPPSAPVKAADKTYTYTFAGWDKEVVAVVADATYTATYTSKYIEYTITFVDDGTVLSTQTYHYGELITSYEASKDGYLFDAWCSDIACTQAYDFETTVTADITLYARWTENSSSTEPISYTVSFDFTSYYDSIGTPTDGRASNPSDIIVFSGETVTEPTKDLMMAGLDQLDYYWYVENEDETISEWDFEKNAVTSNITLYFAVREAAVEPTIYTVTFIDDTYNTETNSQQVEAGNPISEPTDPDVDDGPIFEYWYIKNADGTTTVWDFDNPVTSDMTLYAHWGWDASEPQ